MMASENCRKCKKGFSAETWEGDVLGYTFTLTEIMCKSCRGVGSGGIADDTPEMKELDDAIGKCDPDVSPVWVGKNF